MSFTKESSTKRAITDISKRLMIEESDVSENGIADKDFPDMSLGAPTDGEMAAQMISSGWTIELVAGGQSYEYRADKYQLRLHNFQGKNYVIES